MQAQEEEEARREYAAAREAYILKFWYPLNARRTLRMRPRRRARSRGQRQRKEVQREYAAARVA